MRIKKNNTREEFKIPKSVKDTIPVNRIYKDGIFLLSKDKYSKTFKFTDINYAVAGKQDKEAMFLNYSEILNSFDTGANTKITVLNRKLNKIDFEKNVLIPANNDELDPFRKEYNINLITQTTNSNSMIQEKYLTVTVSKKSLDEARTYFDRLSNEFNSHFRELGSHCIELDTIERLRLIHDFYRVGEESIF